MLPVPFFVSRWWLCVCCATTVNQGSGKLLLRTPLPQPRGSLAGRAAGQGCYLVSSILPPSTCEQSPAVCGAQP